MLRHYILPTQVDWPRHLAFAEFAINNSWQESIQSTPFLVNYGQSPITPMLHKLPRPCLSPSAESFAKKWEHEVKHAQECMRVAQDRQERYENKRRRDVTFSVGDSVLLSTKNLRNAPGKARKFLPRYVGPFKVTGRLVFVCDMVLDLVAEFCVQECLDRLPGQPEVLRAVASLYATSVRWASGLGRVVGHTQRRGLRGALSRVGMRSDWFGGLLPSVRRKEQGWAAALPEDPDSDIEHRDEALQPDLTEAERNTKASGEARAARDRDNTYHGRKRKLAHLIDHLPQELWDAFLAKAVRPRVKACSERAVLASLLLGLLVRGLFTIYVADPLGLHDQSVYTNIPVSQAAIPDLSRRNLFLQLCRGLPGNGSNTQPTTPTERRTAQRNIQPSRSNFKLSYELVADLGLAFTRNCIGLGPWQSRKTEVL
ncbi:hypothetical protein QJQ45_002373 [Haematococcus lacustris]|nr:hypothetical protein QJQ45_002373 [Haematococcus lacustris]